MLVLLFASKETTGKTVHKVKKREEWGKGDGREREREKETKGEGEKDRNDQSSGESVDTSSKARRDDEGLETPYSGKEDEKETTT